MIAIEISHQKITTVIAVGNSRRGLKGCVAVPQEDSAAADPWCRCVIHGCDHIELVVPIEIRHDDGGHRTAAAQRNGLRGLKRAISPAQNYAQSLGTLVTNGGIEFLIVVEVSDGDADWKLAGVDLHRCPKAPVSVAEH